MKKSLLVLLIVLADNNLKSAELEKFLARYGCSQEIEDEISRELAHIPEEKLQQPVTVLSNYVIKSDQSNYRSNQFSYNKTAFNRLVNAIRLQRAIESEGLNSNWRVAQKCWSFRHNKVVAEKIVGDGLSYEWNFFEPGLLLSPEKHTEKEQLIRKTLFIDWHNENVWCDVKTGKFTFIDTEDRSFSDDSHSLSHNTRYDDPDINFELAKLEFTSQQCI